MVASGTRREQAEALRAEIHQYLGTVERYNASNLPSLERYVELQVSENVYDLEANLAILKLYQFFPQFYKAEIACWILLKAIANLPHTDFVLCKCLLGPAQLDDLNIVRITYLANALEHCRFKHFWQEKNKDQQLISEIKGFDDSIRKFVCHVINITYQSLDKAIVKDLLGNVTEAELKSWMAKNGWKEENDTIYVANQEDLIKTKNITEKITFETVSVVMYPLAK